MNSATGGKKLVQTMIKKHGSYEAWRAWMRANGSKGGGTKPTKPRGFAAMTPEQRSAAGKIGGTKSRRGK